MPHPHPRAIRPVHLDIDGFPEIRALRAELFRLRAETETAHSEMVGESPPMRKLAELVARIAPTELPVLIQGETGTGKELLARAIHRCSARHQGPFIAQSCGALPESVLESELFGHEKGAFTGADSRRRGLFELASGGTLFLDEVGEMSPRVQVGLLRALQEGEVRRVGAERATAVNVRVVAATHRDIRQMVAAGEFREDLYYRLRGVTLRVPALRERIADLEQLVAHFMRQAGADLRLTPAAWQALRNHPWPGNVRELRAEVLRWVALCDRVVDAGDLADELTEVADGPSKPSEPFASVPAVAAAPQPVLPLAEAVQEAERAAITRALDSTENNLSRAARALGVDRNTLKRKLARLGIPRGSSRPGRPRSNR